MKPDRSQAGAHLLLNGWQAFHKKTMFDQVDVWYLWHVHHRGFSITPTSGSIWRGSEYPVGEEVDIGSLPDDTFWFLFYRIVSLNLVEKLDD